MEEEILDYNWVIAREVPLKEQEATLFQQYFNEESLILAAAMLHDNQINYVIKVDNPERTEFGNLIHEVHINESELERANGLLELLINEDENYPIKKYSDSSLKALEFLLEENENVYVGTLVKIELKRRGVELAPPEEGAKDFVAIIIVLSFLFILYVIYQFIVEIRS